MFRLILVCLLLSGCVSTSGSVRYSIITELDSQEKIIKTTEMWIGKSHTIAGGGAGIKASQKEIDFGIQMPSVIVYLKARSNMEGIQSDTDDEKITPLRSLGSIFTIP